jgi:hypothetical protein
MVKLLGKRNGPGTQIIIIRRYSLAFGGRPAWGAAAGVAATAAVLRRNRRRCAAAWRRQRRRAVKEKMTLKPLAK